MKERDKTRFHDNITWFNQFFEGIQQLYEYIVDLLPAEFCHEGFSLNSGNFYHPRFKAAPSIPPYYALMLEGRQYALQVVSVIDANIIAYNGPFTKEPSMIVVVHTAAEKYGWLNDFALSLIQNQNVEITTKQRGMVWGKFNTKFSADFLAFQVQYDKFSDNRSPMEAVGQVIVDPIIENLQMVSPESAD